jgi:hypothetical protein
MTYQGFLEAEFVDMVEKGYFVVFPYELVKDLPNLRLSPVGVVPQLKRRPRPNVDCSFYQVKQDTDPTLPKRRCSAGEHWIVSRTRYNMSIRTKDPFDPHS